MSDNFLLQSEDERKKAALQNAMEGVQPVSQVPEAFLQSGATVTTPLPPTYKELQASAALENAQEGTGWQFQEQQKGTFLQERILSDPSGRNADRWFSALFMAQHMSADPQFVYDNYDEFARTFTKKETAPDPGRLWRTMRNAWDSGWAQTKMDYLNYRQMLGDTSEGTQQEIDYWKSKIKPISTEDYGLIGQALITTSNMLPLQVLMGIEGAKAGIVSGMGTATVAALAAAPVMATTAMTGVGAAPGLVGSSAFVGLSFMWGFTQGTRAGSFLYSTQVMQGAAYRQLKEMKDKDGNSVSDRTARMIAIPVGMLVGLIEQMQLETIASSIPGMDKFLGEGIQSVVKQTVLKTLGNAAIRGAAKYGVDVLSEGTEEGIQEIIQIMGERLAAYIENEHGGRFAYQDVAGMSQRVWDATKSGFLGSMLAIAPGHIVGAFTEANQGAKLSDQKRVAEARIRLNEVANAEKAVKSQGALQDTPPIDTSPVDEMPPRDPAMTAGNQLESADVQPNVQEWDQKQQPENPRGAKGIVDRDGQAIPIELANPQTVREWQDAERTQDIPTELLNPAPNTVGEAVSKLANDARPWEYTKKVWQEKVSLQRVIAQAKKNVTVFGEIAGQKYAWVRDMAKRAAPHLADEEVNMSVWVIDMISKVMNQSFEDVVNNVFAPGVFATPDQIATFKEEVAQEAELYAQQQTGWTPEQRSEYVATEKHKAAKARGASRVLNTGKRLIYIFKNGDASTMIEEFTHALRPFIPQHLLDPARPWLGLTADQQWTEAAEEQFAKGLFVYITEGYAPNDQVRSIFKQLAQWIEYMYKCVREWIQLSPEIVNVYDTIFSGRYDDRQNEITRIQPNPHPNDKMDVLFQVDETVEVENDPANVPPDQWLKQSEYQKRVAATYLDENGNRRGHVDEWGDYHAIHSYATPVTDLRLKLGQWLIDDEVKGAYGHEIAQLRKFDWQSIRRLGEAYAPGDVTMSENLVEQNIEGRGNDADRYAKWLQDGLVPPPVTIVETDKGTFKITDGHRRANASIQAKQPLYAWVWPAMAHPKGAIDATTGQVIPVGMTYEGMTGKTFQSAELQKTLFQIDPKDEAKLAKAAKLAGWKGGFGVTKNPAECGYILRDGTMLNMSGVYDAAKIQFMKSRNPNAVKIDKNGHEYVPELAGARYVDHREFPKAIRDMLSNKTPEGRRLEWMRRTGAIRYNLNPGIFQSMYDPSQAQLDTAGEHTSSQESITPELIDREGKSRLSKQMYSPNRAKIEEFFLNADYYIDQQKQTLFQVDEDSIGRFNAEAIATFGTTDNWQNCGYILSDGSMLDFTDRSAPEGMPEGFGRRVHRDIGNVPSVGLNESIRKALEYRAVRVDFSPVLTSLEVGFEPNENQYRQIGEMIKQVKRLNVELTDPVNGKFVTFFEFGGPRGAAMYVDNIKNHFASYRHYDRKFLFDTDPWLYKSVEVIDRFTDKIDKQPAENVRNVLLKNGVKAEEMKWMDLDEYFEERKGKKINVNELHEFISRHAVKLEEIQLGWPAKMPSAEAMAAVPMMGKPRYPHAQYQSAIGDHYRELIMRLPWHDLPEAEAYKRVIPGREAEEASLRKQITNLAESINDVAAEVWKHQGDPDWEGWKENAAITMNKQMVKLHYEHKKLFEIDAQKLEAHTMPVVYRGNPHYEGIDNVVGWIRFKDFTDANAKTLLVDEIQSEWFQNVRERRVELIEAEAVRRGISSEEAAQYVQDSDIFITRDQMIEYQNKRAIYDAEEEIATATLEMLSCKLDDQVIGAYAVKYIHEIPGTRGLMGEPIVAQLKWRETKDGASMSAVYSRYWENNKAGIEGAAEIEKAIDLYVQARNEMAAQSKLAGRYPAAPFVKTWQELCVKRILRWAAENGYDRIAWTTGEMQRDRWKLSDKIADLTATVAFDGAVDLTGWGRDHQQIFTKKRIPAADLKRYVGKDLADRIIAIGKPEKPGQIKEKVFSGVDLDMKGGGMNFQYDKLIPQMFDSLGKKFDSYTYDAHLAGVKYHAIDIVPGMRESAMKPYLFQGDPHEEMVRRAVANQQAVPDEVLNEYNSTDWAKEEIAKREVFVNEALTGDFKNVDEFIDYHDIQQNVGDPIIDFDYWQLMWSKAKAINPYIENVNYRPLTQKEANARMVMSVADPASMGRFLRDLDRMSNGNFDPDVLPRGVRPAYDSAQTRTNKGTDTITQDEFDAAYRAVKANPKLFRELLAEFGDDKERQQIISEKREATEADKARAAALVMIREVKAHPTPITVGNRQIWQISKQEWIDAWPYGRRKHRDFLRMHEYAVRQAVEQGMNPPEKVLDDYPYLRQRIEENKRKAPEWIEPRGPILYSVAPEFSPENLETIHEAIRAIGREPTPALVDTFAMWAQGDFNSFYANVESLMERELAAKLYNALQGAFELKMGTEEIAPEAKVKQELFAFAEKSGVQLQDEMANMNLFPEMEQAKVPAAPEAESPGPDANIPPTPEQLALVTPKPGAVEPPPTVTSVTTVGGTEVTIPYERQEVPVGEIGYHPDIVQFKEDADTKGVVERIEDTKYRRAGNAPIMLWRTLDGKLWVITGRHRLDLANRLGEMTIPADIFNESDGFTVDMACIMDAEANIRDGQGKVRDYAAFFRRTGITEEQASERGLLARVKGKNGYALGAYASDDLYTAYRNKVIGEEQAVAIARGAPRASDVQAAAMARVKELKVDELQNYAALLYSVNKQRTDSGEKQIDLFGIDHSFEQELQAEARAATSIVTEIRQELAAIKAAVKLKGEKRAQFLQKYGISITGVDAESIQARIDSLEEQIVRWSGWIQDRDLHNKVRERAGLSPLAEKEGALPVELPVPQKPEEPAEVAAEVPEPPLPPPEREQVLTPEEIEARTGATEASPGDAELGSKAPAKPPEVTEDDLVNANLEEKVIYTPVQWRDMIANIQKVQDAWSQYNAMDELRDEIIHQAWGTMPNEEWGKLRDEVEVALQSAADRCKTIDGKKININGVVEDANVVCQMAKKHKWGLEIEVAQFPGGWTVGYDIRFDMGDMAGHGSPCSVHGEMFPTAEEATLYALNHAERHYERGRTNPYVEGQVAVAEDALKFVRDKKQKITDLLAQAEKGRKGSDAESAPLPKFIQQQKDATEKKTVVEPSLAPITPETVATDPVVQQQLAKETPTGPEQMPIVLPGGQIGLNISVPYAQLIMERMACEEEIKDITEERMIDARWAKLRRELEVRLEKLNREIALQRMRERMQKRLDECYQKRKQDKEKWKAQEQQKKQQKQIERTIEQMRYIKNNLKYLHAEAADAISDLLDDIDLSISGKGFIRRLGKLKSAIEKDENIDISQDWLDGLDDVAGKSIYALSYEQLSNLANTVMFWWNYNKELETVRIGGEAQRHEQAVEEGLGEMKPEQKLLDDINSTQKPGEKRFDSVKRFLNTFLGIGQLQYNLIVEWIAGPKSLAYRLFVGQIEEGRRKELELKHAWEDYWTAEVSRLKLKSIPKWLAQEYTLVRDKGQTLTITRGQKLSLYLHSLNEDNAASVTGAGVGFRRNRHYRNRPIQISEAALAKLQADVRADPTEMAIIRVAQELMERTAEAIDPVYEERYGFPLPRIKNYWHKDVMPVGRGKTVEGESTMEQLRRRLMRPGPPKGRLKERKGVVVPIFLNSIEQDLMDAINDHSAYAGLEIPMYQAYKLISDREFSQALADRYGPQVMQEITDGMRDIVGENQHQPLAESFFNTARIALQNAYLSFNPFTWLKLTLGYMNGLAYISPEYMLKGGVDFILHPKRVDAINQAMSPYYRDRLEIGFTRDVAEPQKTYESGKLIKARSWYRKMGVKPLQWADRVAVNPVMRGAYLQAISELESGKLSESTKIALQEDLRAKPLHTLQPYEKYALAYKYADWVIQRTQDQRLPEYRSPLSRSTSKPGLVKWFTLFGSNTNTNLNVIVRAGLNAAKNGWNRKSTMKFAQTVVLMMILVPGAEAMVNAMRNFLLKRYGDDEDRWWQVLNDYAGNVFQLSYFLRDIWSTASARISGQWGSELTIAPLSIFNDTIQAGADVWKAATDTGTYRGNKWEKAAWEVSEVIAILARLPVVMPARYIREIVKKAEEE